VSIKTYKENTVRDEANLIASSESSNVQFNALIRVSSCDLKYSFQRHKPSHCLVLPKFPPQTAVQFQHVLQQYPSRNALQQWPQCFFGRTQAPNGHDVHTPVQLTSFSSDQRLNPVDAYGCIDVFCIPRPPAAYSTCSSPNSSSITARGHPVQVESNLSPGCDGMITCSGYYNESSKCATARQHE